MSQILSKIVAAILVLLAFIGLQSCAPPQAAQQPAPQAANQAVPPIGIDATEEQIKLAVEILAQRRTGCRLPVVRCRQ